MRIADILRSKGSSVATVSPVATLADLIGELARHNVGALPVVDDDGRLVGIVSERDYARKVVLEGKSSKDTRVQDIMSSPVFSVGPNHTVDECMRIVTAKRIRHLPVVQGEKVIGVVSIGDLVRRVISTQTETIQYLQEYIGVKYSI